LPTPKSICQVKTKPISSSLVNLPSGGGEICQVGKLAKLDAKLLEAFSFLDLSKKDGCRVEMPNSKHFCDTVYRSNLQVWGLFAPKYVFDVIGLQVMHGTHNY